MDPRVERTLKGEVSLGIVIAVCGLICLGLLFFLAQEWSTVRRVLLIGGCGVLGISGALMAITSSKWLRRD